MVAATVTETETERGSRAAPPRPPPDVAVAAGGEELELVWGAWDERAALLRLQRASRRRLRALTRASARAAGARAEHEERARAAAAEDGRVLRWQVRQRCDAAEQAAEAERARAWEALELERVHRAMGLPGTFHRGILQ
jgi:hypothetical protein